MSTVTLHGSLRHIVLDLVVQTNTVPAVDALATTGGLLLLQLAVDRADRVRDALQVVRLQARLGALALAQAHVAVTCVYMIHNFGLTFLMMN